MLLKYLFIEWIFLEKLTEYPTQWTVSRILKMKQPHSVEAPEPVGNGQLASVSICII